MAILGLGVFGERKVPRDLHIFADERFKLCKQNVIAVYQSQTTLLIDDDPTGFVMPPRYLEHFATNPEIFIDD